MIRKAIVLLPTRPGSLVHTSDLDPRACVGGVPLLRRALYSLQRAGIEEGLVLSNRPWPEMERFVQDDPGNRVFSWVCLQDLKPGDPQEGRLEGVLSGDFALHNPWWIVDRQVLADTLQKAETEEEPLQSPVLVEPERTSEGGIGELPALAVIPGRDCPEVVAAIRAGEPASEIAGRIRSASTRQVRRFPEPALVRAARKQDRLKAEQLLFQGLIKPTESLMSRGFERKISLAITRRLLHTRITPNQISLFSITLGLASALFFLPRGALLHVAGAGLLLLSSIVDGCDGELARLRFQESRRGSWLDFLGDNLVHMAVFFCIGLGLFLRGASPVYVFLGTLGALATLGSAAAVFLRVFRKSGAAIVSFATPVRIEERQRASGKLRRQIDFADKITNRDFIYLILILAAAGQLWVWPWVSGLGASFYFAYLLRLYSKMAALGDIARES